MRIASLKSRNARSRSPFRTASWPLAMSAATLALIGAVTGDRRACGAAAAFAALADSAAPGAGALYGIALLTAKSSAVNTGPFSAFAGPQVMSLKAAKPSSQGGSISVFGASAARPRPETLRAQVLGSDVDDPPPHAAVIIVVADARGSDAGAARTGASRVEPRPANTSAPRPVTSGSPPGCRTQRSTKSPTAPLSVRLRCISGPKKIVAAMTGSATATPIGLARRPNNVPAMDMIA